MKTASALPALSAGSTINNVPKTEEATAIRCQGTTSGNVPPESPSMPMRAAPPSRSTMPTVDEPDHAVNDSSKPLPSNVTTM